MTSGGPRRNAGGSRKKGETQADVIAARIAGGVQKKKGKQVVPANLRKAPPHITKLKYGNKFFNEYTILLVEYGFLCDFDIAAMCYLSELYEDYMQIRDEFAKSKKLAGISKCGSSCIYPPGHALAGQPYKISPMFNALDKARAKWIAALVEFGMTPASRSRVSARPGFDPDAEEDEFDA